MTKYLYIGTAIAALATMAGQAALATMAYGATPASPAHWTVYAAPYALTVTYRGDVYEADHDLTDTDCIDAATDRPYVLKTVGLTGTDAMLYARIACEQTAPGKPE